MAPMMWRNSVLLPQPEPPMMIMVSPFSTENVTPLSTVRGPNFRVSPVISMTGSLMDVRQKRTGR